MPRKKAAVHGFGKYDVTINTQFCVISDGYHNAFLDLCTWEGSYWLAYRRAQWHDPIPPGDVVICKSPDAYNWEEVAVIDSGGDDRDPKFITDQEGWLVVYFGTYYKRWEGKTLSNHTRDQITCGAQSRNGKVWSSPYQIYRPNYWLWSTQEGYNGYTYGMAYHHGNDYCNSLQLIFKSRKRFGVWETVGPALNANLELTDLSEPALFSLDKKNEQFCCIARSADVTLVGTSMHPYTKWIWDEYPVICHSPCVVKAQGKIFVAGRTRLDHIPGLDGEDNEKSEALKKYRNFQKSYEYEDEDHEDITAGKPKGWLSDVYKTVLFEFSLKNKDLKYLLTLPSAKDCAYPGMVYDEDTKELVIAYYSQHAYPDMEKGIPRPADIYVTRVGINDLQGDV